MYNVEFNTGLEYHQPYPIPKFFKFKVWVFNVDVKRYTCTRAVCKFTPS